MTFVRNACLGLLIGASLTLSGCSTPSQVQPNGYGEMSEEQIAALADGEVTSDEYQAGFRRYESCMNEAGWELSVVDDGGYLINYSFLSPGIDDDARCYALEFGALDEGWQLANVDRSETTNILRECLVGFGITPGETRAEIDEQIAEAGIDRHDCFPTT